MNPNVIRDLALTNKINFLINTSLDTEPDGRDISLYKNMSVRYSIIAGSRFNPTIGSAI